MHIQKIHNVYSISRSKAKRDDVIRMANDLISRKKPYIQMKLIEYEVILSYDNGKSEFIHRVEKGGKKSV